ncbi:MAG: general secretion pathway protein GspK [Nitrospirae bacterium]|nr:general secretion pathway protein GspK [Nitrospirota bacterium]
MVARYDEVASAQKLQQGYIYCYSVIKGVARLLQEDKDSYDSSEDLWASLPTIPTPEGYITTVVVPLNSRIPIMGVSSRNEKLRRRTEDALERLLADAPEPPDVESLRDLKPYSLGELRFLAGFSALPRDLLGRFTVEATNGKININFADETVMGAFLPEIEPLTEAIARYRESRPFKDISQIRKVPGMTDDVYLAIQPYITVSSSLYYIFTEAEVGGTRTRVSAVVKKESGKIKILKYFEEAEEFYAAGEDSLSI